MQICHHRGCCTDRRLRHGHSTGGKTSPEYEAWSAMRKRCFNPKHKAYKNYGGRGITIDPRWDDFVNFFTDMGPRPEGMTLERIDNGLGYAQIIVRGAIGTHRIRTGAGPSRFGERAFAKLDRSHGQHASRCIGSGRTWARFLLPNSPTPLAPTSTPSSKKTSRSCPRPTMKLYEIFEERCLEGPLPNDQFKAILAAAAKQFEAQPTKRRRQGRGRPITQASGRSRAHLRYC